MSGFARRTWLVLKDAAAEWSADSVARLGAALAFYTVLSLAPLLVVAVSFVGLAVGQGQVQQQIVQQLRQTTGPAVASTVGNILGNASAVYRPGAGLISSLFGFGVLIVSASVALRQLKVAMNVVWDIPKQERGGFLHVVWNYFVSFLMVLAFALAIGLAIVFKSGLHAFNTRVIDVVPLPYGVISGIDIALALALFALLLAVMYRYLPDTDIAWNDVWPGALFTAVLFGVGQWLIGLYLSHNKLASAYGAAGPFVIVLLWIYYAAQIFLFGAEVTQTYAWHFGSRRHAG